MVRLEPSEILVGAFGVAGTLAKKNALVSEITSST